MSENITDLLKEWAQGSQTALNSLLPIVYEQLRHIAINRLKQEKAQHTLQPTALVNEAYLRLIDCQQVDWQNRTQFFALAARLMRNILVDHARNQMAAKRGGKETLLLISELPDIAIPQDLDIVTLNEALITLEAFDPQQSRIIELRYFAGLTIEETAMILNLSPSTVKREWNMARAWLLRELS